jgi:hypothetical protein
VRLLRSPTQEDRAQVLLTNLLPAALGRSGSTDERAQAKLAEMRARGLSPGHGGEAAKRRGATIAESNRRRALGLSPEETRARKVAQARERRASSRKSDSDKTPE